jgi:hypothetical protein
MSDGGGEGCPLRSGWLSLSRLYSSDREGLGGASYFGSLIHCACEFCFGGGWFTRCLHYCTQWQHWQVYTARLAGTYTLDISVKYQFNLKIQLLNYISLYWDVWFFKNTTTIVLWHWKQCFQFHLKPCLTGRNLQASCRTWGNSTSSGPACRRWRANLF